MEENKAVGAENMKASGSENKVKVDGKTPDENPEGKSGASIDKAVEAADSGKAKVVKSTNDSPASKSDPNPKILASVDPAKPNDGAAEAPVDANVSPEGKGKKKDKKKKAWFSMS